MKTREELVRAVKEAEIVRAAAAAIWPAARAAEIDADAAWPCSGDSSASFAYALVIRAAAQNAYTGTQIAYAAWRKAKGALDAYDKKKEKNT